MSSNEQLARTQLRSGFLSVINNLKGRSVISVILHFVLFYFFLFSRKSELTTCEGNSLDCTLIGVDRCVENISVENLKTPIGTVIPHAVVRLPDLDKIVCPQSS